MTNSKERFAITEGGNEDADDDAHGNFIAIKFSGKKFLDAKRKVTLDCFAWIADNLSVSDAIVLPPVLPPEKRLTVVVQPFYKKGLQPEVPVVKIVNY